MMILDSFPTADEFYETYWGKKPFIVRGYISPALIESCIDGDTLAGLALEETIQSRIITNNAAGQDWVCEHDPFADGRFSELGEKNWSVLVQNVEQYHTDTAALLPHFQLSPRWLMDDIMVSYSAPGGSVGPHTDSYHTFLVQGIGKRTWKISADPVDDDRYVDNPDVKVLAHGFDGETFEVTAGDVIYMPPFFGHEGKTIEAAMTFSIGFLGPKLSEMMGEYAHYLEQHETRDKRYLGNDLNADSAGFNIAPGARDTLQNNLIAAVQSDDFSVWLAQYFSSPSHDDADCMAMHDDEFCPDNAPDHVKIATAPLSDGTRITAINGETIPQSPTHHDDA